MESEQRSWKFGRRAILGGGVATLGAALVRSFGGTSPAAAGVEVCYGSPEFSGVTCSGSGHSYFTACDRGGCFREGVQSSSFNCPNSTYGVRHRTCGEDQVINGDYKRYAMRFQDCWPTDSPAFSDDFEKDGWEWRGVDGGDSCGCGGFAQIPYYQCNDGYLWVNGGTRQPSICMTKKCSAF